MYDAFHTYDLKSFRGLTDISSIETPVVKGFKNCGASEHDRAFDYVAGLPIYCSSLRGGMIICDICLANENIRPYRKLTHTAGTFPLFLRS